MRTLHVAAMPFPTPQGTQAALFAMVDALGRAGHDAHLLTYARGSGEKRGAFTHHRSRDLPGRDDFRSGPSLRKVAADALLAMDVARLVRELSPDVVVAHHVEAAAACLLAGARPLWFFAHTSLTHELPTYGAASTARLAAKAGGALDAFLARRADRVLAISPTLADELRATRPDTHFVPTPWSAAPAVTPAERQAARAHFALPPDAEVILYAGNLDAYQGWELAVDAFLLAAAARPHVHAVIATESDAAALLRHAPHLGHRLRIVPLAGDTTRRRAFAASDIAVVPRRSPGGLPIKLLEALAHGIPTVVQRRAAAGLPLTDATVLVPDDDAHAMARALTDLLADSAARTRLAAAGRAHLTAHHGAARFVSAMQL